MTSLSAGVQPQKNSFSRLTKPITAIKQSPLRTLSWALLAAIAFFMIYPMVGVLWRTYGPDGKPFDIAAFSVRLIPVLRDTAIVALGATLIAVVVGVLLAWAHERTNANLGWVGELLPLSTLLIPAVAGVVGWIILFDPKVGYANAALRWLSSLFGSNLDEGPINVYSMQMVIVISAVYLVPYVFLIMTSALQTLDSAMEEASRVSGASAMRTFFLVVLPSLAPSLGAAVVISIIRSVTTFIIIAVIGTTANVETLPVYIFHLMSSFPSRTGAAVLLAFGLMIFIQLMLFVQSKVIKPGRYASIGGKGSKKSRTNLGFFRPLVQALIVAYLFVTSVLPALAVLLVSIQPAWTANIDLSRITFDAYTSLIPSATASDTTARAIQNSLWLALLGATIVTVIAVIILSAQRDLAAKVKRFSVGLMATPAMIPHSLIGVAFIISFSPPPFSLYGTVALLLIAYVLMEVPYASQATQAVIASVGKELPEASRVFGAGEFQTFRRILIPIMFPALAAAWIVVFIHMMTETTASALLSGINNPVVGPQMLGLVSHGTYGEVAALAMVITLVSAVMVILALIVRRKSAKNL